MKIVKKLLKFTGITFLVLLLLLILVPLLFGDQIKEAVKNYVNDQLTAEVYFGDLGVSVFKAFPDVTVTLNDFGVVGLDEFRGDTLANVDELRVTVDLYSVLFGDEYVIEQVGMVKPRIYAKVLNNGKPNWDIVKVSGEEELIVEGDTAASSPIALNLKDYWVKNGTIVYDDHFGLIYTKVENLNHTGSGNFMDDTFLFDTHTDATEVTFRFDGVEYLTKAKLEGDIELNIDNAAAKYTLKENTLSVNELSIGLDGDIAMPNGDVVLNLKFDTKNNRFSSILSMVPGMYTQDFDDLDTDGTFSLNGDVTGTYNATSLPGFNVNMGVTNGYFKYPDLPESVKDINFTLKVNCPDGDFDRLKIDFPKFHAMFGTAPIDAKLILTGLTSPLMGINANLKTNIELEKLMQMFPMEGQTLKGNFMADVNADGKYSFDGKTFPKVNGTMKLSNGYYKTNDFPSALENMRMSATMTNEDGSLEKTYINVSEFHSEIDGDPIDATLTAENMADIKYALTAKGNLDLTKLNKIYPIEGQEMAGQVKLDLTTSGQLSDIEAGRYAKLPTSGSMQITGMKYKSLDFPQGMKITASDITFDPQKLNIKNFTGSVGRSPISVNGYLDNYLAYALMENENLHGVMSLTSAKFDVNEWMVEEPTAASTAPSGEAPSEPVPMEVVPIPANIDLTFKCVIAKVLYDNLTLERVRGNVIMRNQEVKFEQLNFNALDGTFRMSGSYNTQDITKPTYKINFNLGGLNIQKAYETFNTVQLLAPAAKFVQGNFNSDFTLSGLLNGDMTPNLATITSLGKMTVVNGKVSNFPVIDKIADKVKLATMKTFDLKDTKIFFEVHDGRLWVDPFDMKIGNVDMIAEGSNGLDGGIDYDVDLNFPAGKIGSTAVNALSGLTGKTVGANEDINIKLGLGGTALQPKITSINSSATDVVGDVKEDLKEKVDDVKEDVKEKVDDKIDEAKAKAKAEADKILAEAEKRAADIRAKAKVAADKLREEANQRADEIEKSAKNPLEKAAKKKLADKTREAGEESAQKVEKQADERADHLIEEARKRVDVLLK